MMMIVVSLFSCSHSLNGRNDQWAIETRWWARRKKIIWIAKRNEKVVASWVCTRKLFFDSIRNCWCSNWTLFSRTLLIVHFSFFRSFELFISINHPLIVGLIRK